MRRIKAWSGNRRLTHDLRGEITNAAAVGGLLAASHARDEGWATLRPGD